MKTCPSCHRTYEDETLKFCLDDGAALRLANSASIDPNATLHLPSHPKAEPGPTIPSPQATLTYRPEPRQTRPQRVATPAIGSPERTRTSALPWIFGIAIVISISSIAIALILTRDRANGDQQTAQKSVSPSSQPDATPEESNQPSRDSEKVATPEKTTEQRDKKKELPTPKSAVVTRAAPSPSPYDPTKRRTNEGPDKPAFGPMMNNVTFNGTNLTYYPRASSQLCQSDCANNQRCRGFTWVKPGGYKAGDSPMCYLISSISNRVSHPCCMSAMKNR